MSRACHYETDNKVFFFVESATQNKYVGAVKLFRKKGVNFIQAVCNVYNSNSKSLWSDRWFYATADRVKCAMRCNAMFVAVGLGFCSCCRRSGQDPAGREQPHAGLNWLWEADLVLSLITTFTLVYMEPQLWRSVFMRKSLCLTWCLWIYKVSCQDF